LGADEINFNTEFELKDYMDRAITLQYFAFTTISTVGLGDYHPIADRERILGAFFLLFGVLLTSVVMDNLNQMLVQFKEFDTGFSDSDKLYLFIGTIHKFNRGGQTSTKMYQKIVDYFQYRWLNNKTEYLINFEGSSILSKVPS